VNIFLEPDLESSHTSSKSQVSFLDAEQGLDVRSLLVHSRILKAEGSRIFWDIPHCCHSKVFSLFFPRRPRPSPFQFSKVSSAPEGSGAIIWIHSEETGARSLGINATGFTVRLARFLPIHHMPITISTALKIFKYPLHWYISMHTPIFNILSHIHKQGFDFFGRPA
jgi:hypothetical protein